MGQHLVTLTEAEQFFFENAGYSYDPKRETATSGRTRCAIILADAEYWLKGTEGVRVTWEEDPERCGCGCGGDHGPAWIGVLRQDGDVLATLGGCTFSSGEPWGDPYARVISAELVTQYRDGS